MTKTARTFAIGVLGAATLAAAPAFAQTLIDVQISQHGRHAGPQYPQAQYPSPNYPRSNPGNAYSGPQFQGAPRQVAPAPFYRVDDPRARWAYQNEPPMRRPRDLDRDGIPDRYDRDLDNDGVRNRRDRDIDGDGVPNWHDRRPDNPYRY